MIKELLDKVDKSSKTDSILVGMLITGVSIWVIALVFFKQYLQR